MKLFYVPLTSSFRPRWLLEEIGMPHELVRLTLSPKDTKSPEYLQIHPLGQVPALVDGDVTVIESAAICMYLAERDPARTLLPGDSLRERAGYYQWIFYAMDTLSPVIHPVYLRWFLASPEEKSKVATEADFAAAERVFSPIVKGLGEKPFLLGERITTADIVMGGILQWAEAAGVLARCPELRAYHERLRARPAYERATQ
jgi:glutathione S-transferase